MSKVKLTGFQKFIQFFDPKIRNKNFKKRLKAKMKEQLKLLRKDIHLYIDNAEHGIKNSPLTIMLKGRDRPLIDTRTLRKSIRFGTSISAKKVEGACGLRKGVTHPNGKDLSLIGAALHNGYTVQVNERVRRAIFWQLQQRLGKRFSGFRFKGNKKTHYVVRGRPYILSPFQKAEKRIKKALGNGVKLSLKDR